MIQNSKTLQEPHRKVLKKYQQKVRLEDKLKSDPFVFSIIFTPLQGVPS